MNKKEEVEIAKSESNLNKKIVYITVLILISITIVSSIIYNKNVRMNNFYDSEKEWANDRKIKAAELVEEKREQYNNVRKKYDYEEGTMGYSIYIEKYKEEYKNALSEAVDASKNYVDTLEYEYKETDTFLIISCCTGIITIFIIVFSLYIMNTRIVITNKRLYVKSAFGKRVDLPLDTISSVGTSFFKGIDIGTSSGKIHVKGIMNNNEIHTEISKLLNDRQIKKTRTSK